MSLTLKDKKYLREMVRDEIARATQAQIAEQVQPTSGGYDGATECKDDVWSVEDRHCIIGFGAR